MFYLKQIIINNRAPFKELNLEFEDKHIFVLNAVNGGGKTTILSHIVDALYEMAKPSFHNEFENVSSKYYRVSSNTFNLDNTKPSLVYMRFVFDDQNIDYVDINGEMDEEMYNRLIDVDNKINFSSFSNNLTRQKYIKYCSNNINNENNYQDIFNNNLATYFPFYRFENPGYLNNIYQEKIQMNFQQKFNGYMTNPIEVVKDFQDIAAWIMDVVLDWQLYRNEIETLTQKGQKIRIDITNEKLLIWENLNSILTNILYSKAGNSRSFRLGIGKRKMYETRISIMSNDNLIYPSIFNMSAGEKALLAIFAEILRQADNIYDLKNLSQIKGLVLIDEIDKHLHMNLQKNALHNLFSLFPNVQFIISSHSPIVSIGLQENINTNYKTEIIDLDRGGKRVNPREIREFTDLYKLIKKNNDNYIRLYKTIEERSNSDKLCIITEGNNVLHINKAIEILAPELLSKIDIVNGIEDNTGKDQLKELFKQYEKVTNSKFLFVWDCDVSGIDELQPQNSNFIKFTFSRNENNKKVLNGIENLYSKNLFDNRFCEKLIIKYDNNSCKSVEYKVKKNDFLNMIQSKNSKLIFKNYKPLIDKIKDLI